MKFRVTKPNVKTLCEAKGWKEFYGNNASIAADIIEEILKDPTKYDLTPEEIDQLNIAYNILFDCAPHVQESLKEKLLKEGYNRGDILSVISTLEDIAYWDTKNRCELSEEDLQKIVDVVKILKGIPSYLPFEESLKEAKDVNLSDKSNSISGLLLAGKDKIDSATSQPELIKICSELLADKGGAKAQQFLGVLKSKKGHYNALKYVYDFILAGEGMRSPDSQRKSKSVQRREALQQGKSLFESNGVTEDDLIKQGFERVSGRKGFEFYRKLVDGKGKWYAVKDGEVMPITYMQARGYQPIDSDEAMGMKLGGILLPH